MIDIFDICFTSAFPCALIDTWQPCTIVHCLFAYKSPYNNKIPNWFFFNPTWFLLLIASSAHMILRFLS